MIIKHWRGHGKLLKVWEPCGLLLVPAQPDHLPSADSPSWPVPRKPVWPPETRMISWLLVCCESRWSTTSQVRLVNQLEPARNSHHVPKCSNQFKLLLAISKGISGVCYTGFATSWFRCKSFDGTLMNPFSEPSESHGTHYEQCGKINVIAHWINHSFTRWDASKFSRSIELGKSRFLVSWSVLVCVVEPYSPRSAQAHLARVQEMLKAVRPQDALIEGRSPAVLNTLTQTAGKKYSNAFKLLWVLFI